MSKIKKDYRTYYVLITAAIIFTVCDLVANGLQLLVPSLVFSSTTMIITFVGAQKSKALKADENVDKSIEFIKNNFDKANIILSIIDVIFCIIALFTGLFIIALISRSALAIRLLVIINKYKTVSYSIIFFVLTYLFKRGENFSMADNENKKKSSFFKKIWNGLKVAGQWIFANKKSIIGTICSIIAGVTSAIVANADIIVTLPALIMWNINFTGVIVGMLVFAGVEVGVVGKGFETIKEFVDRVKVEKAEKLEAKNEKVVAKAEAKAKKAEDKKLAQAEALVEKRKKEAERKAKEDAEKAEIEALADKLMAEENNNNNNVAL